MLYSIAANSKPAVFPRLAAFPAGDSCSKNIDLIKKAISMDTSNKPEEYAKCLVKVNGQVYYCRFINGKFFHQPGYLKSVEFTMDQIEGWCTIEGAYNAFATSLARNPGFSNDQLPEIETWNS